MRGRPFEKGHKINLGRRLSEEHKKNLSLSHKGQLAGHKFQKGEKAHLGFKHSEEAKRKISLAHKGKPSWNKGKSLSVEHRRKLSMARKGKREPNVIGLWHNRGYIYVKCEDHPYASKSGYVKRSRLVMEAMLGRVLFPWERVHHINGVKNDDWVENLMHFSDEREHQKLEIKERQRDINGRLLAQKDG